MAKINTNSGWIEDKALTTVMYPADAAIVINMVPTTFKDSFRETIPITFLPCSFTVDNKSGRHTK